MPSITLCSVSTMNGRLTALMPTITANSVNMISSGVDERRAPIRLALTTPLVPNATIQPAARTALPTNSGSTTSMISMFLKRRLRARQHIGEREAEQQADARWS